MRRTYATRRRWHGHAILSLLLALPLLSLPACRVKAERMPAAVVAIVDYQRILRDARAAKSIREQIEERRKKYQQEIREQEKALLERERELSRQRSVLSPEAFQKRRRAFEQEASRVQRLVQERRRELDAASAEAYARIRNVIIEIVGGLARDRGFNLVLPSSAVLLFSPKLDLTEDVLRELDRRLPAVEVPWSAKRR